MRASLESAAPASSGLCPFALLGCCRRGFVLCLAARCPRFSPSSLPFLIRTAEERFFGISFAPYDIGPGLGSSRSSWRSSALNICSMCLQDLAQGQLWLWGWPQYESRSYARRPHGCSRLVLASRAVAEAPVIDSVVQLRAAVSKDYGRPLPWTKREKERWASCAEAVQRNAPLFSVGPSPRLHVFGGCTWCRHGGPRAAPRGSVWSRVAPHVP